MYNSEHQCEDLEFNPKVDGSQSNDFMAAVLRSNLVTLVTTFAAILFAVS